MADQLRVGDVCIFVGLHSRCQEFNGTECVIIEGLDLRYGHSSHREEWCFKIRAQLDGAEWLVQPQYLRKKPPPEAPYDGNQTVDWNDCVWRPKAVTA